jgi:hypothetical protein
MRVKLLVIIIYPAKDKIFLLSFTIVNKFFQISINVFHFKILRNPIYIKATAFVNISIGSSIKAIAFMKSVACRRLKAFTYMKMSVAR